MEKKTGTIEPGNKYTGNMDLKEEKVIKNKIETALIRFKANRSYDLHIGRECISFLPYQTLPVPITWLSHKDWDNVKKNFDIIKE